MRPGCEARLQPACSQIAVRMQPECNQATSTAIACAHWFLIGVLWNLSKPVETTVQTQANAAGMQPGGGKPNCSQNADCWQSAARIWPGDQHSHRLCSLVFQKVAVEYVEACSNHSTSIREYSRNAARRRSQTESSHAISIAIACAHWFLKGVLRNL